MPKKKKKIISLEVSEPNSTWNYSTGRTLTNFICFEDDAPKIIMEMDKRETWKHERDYEAQVKAILAPSGTRNFSNTFFTDEVYVEEVKLPSSIRPSVPYIYKVYDYTGDKLTTDYCTQKEAIAHITKRIKTKYATVSHNGESERIEYDPHVLSKSLDELEADTTQFVIEPASRPGANANPIIIAIFKNCLSRKSCD